MGLFEQAIERKVITVPGRFFDVNPGKRRSAVASRFHSYSRFSFGPPREVLELACDRLQALVDAARSGG
jgi:aspartate/methionine/tyrosine aminotransferase